MSLTKQTIVRVHGNGPITIPLTNPDTGASFSVTGYALLLTAKETVDDADANAVFQKFSEAGHMTVANPTVVTMATGDYTDVVRDKVYQFDVKAIPTAGGMPITVAIGSIRFAHEITRENTPSVSLYSASALGVLNRVSTVPASSTADGTTNQYAVDSDYFYLCIATNTWRRFSLNDWS